VLKRVFHNSKLLEEEVRIRKEPLINSKQKLPNVDINKLLNRVRVNKKKEKKEKLIFLGLGIFTVGLMGIFILFVS
jgi:hypothetical protein